MIFMLWQAGNYRCIGPCVTNDVSIRQECTWSLNAAQRILITGSWSLVTVSIGTREWRIGSWRTAGTRRGAMPATSRCNETRTTCAASPQHRHIPSCECVRHQFTLIWMIISVSSHICRNDARWGYSRLSLCWVLSNGRVCVCVHWCNDEASAGVTVLAVVLGMLVISRCMLWDTQCRSR